ncbi:MAG: UDP-3-O-(3-hydroxymyristoyl)glucosamine N-acyltransferase [Bdellovibrionaceae bacterium]|nr:UDP-3-O-(3-hydroxymyristoyl)glucosamine N-acyltransferase [Pseudobdellovibrionaceae bacterium]
MIQLTTIADHLSSLVTEHEGSLEIPITGVSSPEEAQAGSIIFVSQPHLLEKALKSSATALVLGLGMKTRLNELRELIGGRPILYSPEAERAMREVIFHFFLKTPHLNTDFDATGSLIHPTAIIHPSAKLSTNVRVGPYSIISRDVTVGAGTTIAAHVNIEHSTSIGERTVIHPFVYIGHSCVIGNECEINPNSTIGKEGFGYAHDLKFNHYRIPHQGRVIIEDRAHLGARNTIDRGTFGDTRIGQGAVLDNQVHIAHNSSVGANSIITAGFRLAGSTKIGKNFVAGGNSVVTGHIEVCDNVQLSAVSAVSKAITKPGKYGGNPLLPLQDHIRMKVAMTKLPALLKALKIKDED